MNLFNRKNVGRIRSTRKVFKNRCGTERVKEGTKKKEKEKEEHNLDIRMYFLFYINFY